MKDGAYMNSSQIKRYELLLLLLLSLGVKRKCQSDSINIFQSGINIFCHTYSSQSIDKIISSKNSNASACKCIFKLVSIIYLEKRQTTPSFKYRSKGQGVTKKCTSQFLVFPSFTNQNPFFQKKIKMQLFFPYFFFQVAHIPRVVPLLTLQLVQLLAVRVV